MADRKPLKLLPDGGGDSTGLGEFVAGDTLGVVDGGTGLATVATSNILTGNGTSALSAESNLTFDGNHLTLADGDLVIGTSGHGIDFSATSDGAGTDSSELLDDYEEGTFSPVMKYTPSGGSATAYTNSTNTYAAYVKVGHMVNFYIQIQISNPHVSNAADAPITFTGMPYASNADNPGSNQFAYPTHQMRMVIFNESNAILAPYTPSNSSEINGFIYYNNGSTGWSSLMSDMIYRASGTGDQHIQITGTYRAA